jgi:hypothetical protein
MSVVSRRKVGFWSSGFADAAAAAVPGKVHGPKSPVFHVDASWRADERQRLVRALRALQAHLCDTVEDLRLSMPASAERVICFRGWSTCRICRCKNGTQEFVSTHFTWPEGYLHYIRDHSLRPPAEFVEFVFRRCAELGVAVPDTDDDPAEEEAKLEPLPHGHCKTGRACRFFGSAEFDGFCSSCAEARGLRVRPPPPANRAQDDAEDEREVVMAPAKRRRSSRLVRK